MTGTPSHRYGAAATPYAACRAASITSPTLAGQARQLGQRTRNGLNV
jgi:hypothetical protein